MAFGSVSDILLKITGDPSDASEAIAELAGELAVFSKTSAEAEADVATEEATKKLQLLRARLESIDLETATPEVKAKVAIALAELEIVESKMHDLDGQNATVDVDVRRGTLERLGAVSTKVLGLTKSVRDLDSGNQGLFSSFGSIGTVIGPFTARLGELGPILAALSPLIVSVAGAIIALASSLTLALGGVAALGIAFGGVLATGIGFGIAAIARFKAQANTAGTPANALKTAFQGIGDAAKKLLPAVDPVFTALANGLNGLKPLLGFIAPAFKQFGQAAADSVTAFVKVLSSPAIAAGIANLISLSSGALTPLAQISAQVFRIFLNIANAALPFLVSGLQDVAGALGGIGDATGNLSAMRGAIGQMVGILGVWLQLIGAVGKALLGIVTASAGPGTELVKFFTKGAQALADWANSAQGQQQIKQFFSDTLPLVEQLVTLIGHLIVIFTEVGQALAPVLTPFVAVLNIALNAVQQLLGLFLSIPTPIRTAFLAAAAILIAFLTGVGEVTAAILIVVGTVALLKEAFSLVGGAATAAFQAVVTAATAAWNAVKGILASPVNFVVHLLSGPVLAVAKTLWAGVKGIITGPIQFVITLSKVALSLARTLWSGVKSVISKGIPFVLSLPRTALSLARTLWSGVKSVISAGISFVIHLPGVGGLVSVAHSIWNAINSALPDITISIHIPTPSIPHIHIPFGSMHPMALAGEVIADKWIKGINHGLDGMTKELALKLSTPLSDLDPSLSMSSIGALSPAGAVVGGGRSVVNHFAIEVPEGEQPDAESTLAILQMKMRARGQWGG